MTNLLSRLKKEGNPLIDDGKATFVFEGSLPPILYGDFNNWGSDPAIEPMTLAAPGVWTQTMELPDDTYMEYVFDMDGERTLDPNNPRTVWNGIEDLQNWFRMPKGAINPLTRRVPGIARGTVTQHLINGRETVAGDSRSVHMYIPHAEANTPVPLIVVYDGNDYLKRGAIVNIVDNLIGTKRIRPVAMVMPQNGRQARFLEYFGSEVTLAFVHEFLIPLAEKELAAANLKLIDHVDEPGIHGVIGASMGGLMALTTGLRLPHIFGRVISQSGAFGFRLGEVEMSIYETVRKGDVRPLKIWMDVGRFEWLLEANRKMHSELTARGYDVTYREFNAGHNYTAWGDSLPRAIELMYGM